VNECGGVICADLGSSNLRSLAFLDEGFCLYGVNRLCIRRYLDSNMFAIFEATLL